LKRNDIICKKRKSVVRIILVVIVVVITLVVLSAYLITYHLRPMVKPIANARAKSIATRAINTAVEEELAKIDIGYDDLVTFVYDEENRVTLLSTDSLMINRLKSQLSVAIVNNVSNLENATISLYLGDIISSELFSKQGPKINIIISPVGYVETDIENSFTSAGINQTRHQLILNVTVTIGIVMQSYTEYTDVSTGIVLGESILLGNVPENYTSIGDDELSRELWDDINNYLT